MKKCRGTVFRGPAYASERFSDFLTAEGVLHLFSLPRTPQHNPWVERGNRDLKEESGLGKGVVLADANEAARRVADALVRVDGARQLRRHGYRTAAAVDAELAVPYTAEDRERLRDDVHQRTREALLDAPNWRAVRLAERQAILEALEDHEWITRTRGGRPLRAVKAEGVS